VAQAFSDIIDAKSSFTFNHSKRVAGYVDILAERMGISKERRRWLYRGSLLHDLGKLGISNAILDKPGELTQEEYAQIQLHPKYTEEILSKISIFKELAIVAGAHHERLDGTGYYKGLKGDQICLETRILSFAEIFDALTVKHSYREAGSVQEALSIMEGMRGTAIDGNCLDAFMTVLGNLKTVNADLK
jgi:HD-GYP domain-containing protein (c-di-GMP phosphodiesterase class II)